MLTFWHNATVQRNTEKQNAGQCVPTAKALLLL